MRFVLHVRPNVRAYIEAGYNPSIRYIVIELGELTEEERISIAAYTVNNAKAGQFEVQVNGELLEVERPTAEGLLAALRQLYRVGEYGEPVFVGMNKNGTEGVAEQADAKPRSNIESVFRVLPLCFVSRTKVADKDECDAKPVYVCGGTDYWAEMDGGNFSELKPVTDPYGDGSTIFVPTSYWHTGASFWFTVAQSLVQAWNDDISPEEETQAPGDGMCG